ncbi:carbohydrate ABC transporter permease [Streptomyces shenzhenensis]|uniref:ABC transporter permease n=1 Tax=Streptomyces shenzhenensis TaxID=943815 RepID=A0A3M0I3R7_9ACTN|nr:carbohydrate ABC transporter permease [Streptomyces shenzhenensis]RMB83857.1 ABC transporter permease [Streptomyces shenzhenensis]
MTATSSAPGERRTRSRRWGAVVSQTALTLVLLAYLFPFIWMVTSSLKPSSEIFANPPRLVGSSVEWGNYSEMLDYLPFGRLLLNSVIVAALGATLAVLVSVCAAYAFARLRFRGRNLLFVLLLSTLMVPQEVVVIPMFTMMRTAELDNSYLALILPWAFTAFGTFLLRQFFLNLPYEIEEAAYLDGLGRFRTLWRIVVPMARPAIAVLFVFTFLSYWNSFLWPLIIVNSLDKATVPLGLQMFMGQNGNQWHLMMAAATLSVLPAVLLLIVLRRQLVAGVALGGLGNR